MADLIKPVKEALAGGGANNAFNFELHCGKCKNLLGPLGVFAERSLSPENAVLFRQAGAPVHAGDVVRIAHCLACHCTTIVRREDGRSPALIPAVKMPHNPSQCAMCQRSLDTMMAPRARA